MRVARGVSLCVGAVVVGEDIVEGAARAGWSRRVEGDCGGLLEVPMRSGMDVCCKRMYTLADLW